MDLYTLDSYFRPLASIDNYQTLIWTERYSATGDFKLSCAASPTAVAALKEGLFLGCSVTKEVGLIDTVEIENNILTASGDFLTGFLQYRGVRYTANHAIKFQTYSGRPGNLMTGIVTNMCVTGGTGLTGTPPPVYGGAAEAISNLTVLDSTPTSAASLTNYQIDFTNVYQEVSKIAQANNTGFSMYLASSSPSSYALKFEAYLGLDRTRGNAGGLPVVQFASNIDSLSGVKEFRSLAGYYNVAYTYSPNLRPTVYSGTDASVGVSETDSGTTKSNFQRRTVVNLDEDITTAEAVNLADLNIKLAASGRKLLDGTKPVLLIDGQLVPSLASGYGTDYKLGDLVEMVALSGASQKARVTEYIRSRDESGDRSYPTLSIIP